MKANQKANQKPAPEAGVKAKPQTKMATKMEDAKIPEGEKKKTETEKAKHELSKAIADICCVANTAINSGGREILAQLAVAVAINDGGSVRPLKDIAKKSKTLYSELFGEEYKEENAFDFGALVNIVQSL